MQAHSRNLLILGLAATSGSLDSWSYFALAHTFVANMTGNTVLAGFGLATGDWHPAAGASAAIAAYSTGVFIGSLLSRPIHAAQKQAEKAETGAGTQTVFWPARVTSNLLIEWLLIALAAGLAATGKSRFETFPAYALVCLTACGVGIQSATMAAIKVPGIVTTYISGTWTALIAGLAHLLDRDAAQSVDPWYRYLDLQASVLAIYFTAAAASGALMHFKGPSVLGWLPVALLAATVAGAFAGSARQAP